MRACVSHPSLCLPASLLLFGAIGFTGFPLSYAAPSMSCSAQMSSHADSLLAYAGVSWPTLYEHQKTFAASDDGALAEGYSDAVVRLFAYSWEQFDEFSVLAEQHPAFKHWALRRIDASAADEDLHTIVSNTTVCVRRVPSDDLCRSIRAAAMSAARESARLRRSE